MASQLHAGGPGNKVNVAVRLRPLIAREIDNNLGHNWTVEPQMIIQIDPSTNKRKEKGEFTFDHVFPPESSTKQVYDDVVSPIVKEAFNGFNGTVMCYGMTSSGKTHTLYGSESDPGIIGYLAAEIEEKIAASSDGKLVIRLNLIEIYNENVKDLLSSEKEIEIVEKDGTVIPYGAEHIDIVSAKDIHEAAKRLQRERRLGETRMNKQSSRSHTILRITINSFEGDANESDDFGEGDNRIISAVLNFVDLAGSEKASQTGAQGERLREAGHINTSLSALSKVVMQLSEQWERTNRDNGKDCSYLITETPSATEARRNPKPRILQHISYRDSKLTRILQSSLGGDALVAIICNATPASIEETYSTLRFAMNAKKIQTKPKKNLITNKIDKSKYEARIQELQDELFQKSKEFNDLRETVQALQERNILHSGRTGLKDFESQRRKTFHFRGSKLLERSFDGFAIPKLPSTDWPSTDWSSHSVSMIETLPTSTEDAFMGFRQPNKKFTSKLRKTDQFVQTEKLQPKEDATPPKKRKITSGGGTPISTVLMGRSLLSHDIEESRKIWNEEKEFYQNENKVLKDEIEALKLQLSSQHDASQNFEKERTKWTKEIEELKMKYATEIQNLKESKEFEVNLLSQQISKRDKIIKDLKADALLAKESSCSNCTSSSVELEDVQELRSKLESLAQQLDQSKKESISIESTNLKYTETLKSQLDDCLEENKLLESLVAEFKATLAETDLEFASSSEKLEQLEVEKMVHLKEFDLVKSNLETIRKEYDQLKVEKEMVAEKYQTSCQEISTLTEALENTKQVVLPTQVNSENQTPDDWDQSKDVQELRGKLESLAQQLDQSNKEFSTNLKYTETLKSQLDDCLEENKLLESQVAEFKAMLAEKDLEFASSSEKLKQLEVEKMIHLKEFDLVKSNLETICKDCDQLKVEKEKVAEKFQMSCQEISSLKETLENTERVVCPTQVNSENQTPDDWDQSKDVQELKSKLESLAQQLDQAQKESINIESANLKYTETLKSHLNDCLEENKLLESHVAEFKATLAEKDLEFASSSEKLKQLEVEQMVHLKEFDSVKINLEIIREECDQLKVEKEKVAEKYQMSCHEISSLTEALENTKRFVRPTQVNSENQTPDDWDQSKDVQELRSKLESLAQQLDQSKKESISVESTNLKNTETLKSQLNNCLEENKLLEGLVAELRATLVEKDVEFASSSQKLKQLEVEKMVHLKEFDLVKSNLETIRKEYDQLKVEKEMVAEKYQTSCQEISTLTEALENTKQVVLPTQVNSENQTPDDWDQSKDVQELRGKLESLAQQLDQSKKESNSIGSTNLKYTETLKSQLKDCWKENKLLESQVAELKATLVEKDVEFASSSQKLKQLEVEKMVPLKEFDLVKSNLEALRKECDQLKVENEKVAEKFQMSCQEIVCLKETLENTKRVVRPTKVNRGNQTPDDWDQSRVMHDLKVRLRLAGHHLEQSKKVNSELTLQNKREVTKLQQLADSKSKDVEILQDYIANMRQEKERLKESKVDSGIQCEYIAELLERSKNGEEGILPPEFPDVGKLKNDYLHKKNRLFIMESALSRCTCNPKSKRLLVDRIPETDPDLKENFTPIPPKKPFVSKMGSASNIPNRKGYLNCLKPTPFERSNPSPCPSPVNPPKESPFKLPVVKVKPTPLKPITQETASEPSTSQTAIAKVPQPVPSKPEISPAASSLKAQIPKDIFEEELSREEFEKWMKKSLEMPNSDDEEEENKVPPKPNDTDGDNNLDKSMTTDEFYAWITSENFGKLE